MHQGASTPCAGRLCLAVLLLIIGAASAAEGQQPRTVLVGAFLENNYSTRPGVQVGYSSEGILGGAPRFSAAYSTTRLATAMGSNALVEDRVHAGAGWHFRRDRLVSPHVTARAGYARYDVDDGEVFALLDNGAAFVSVVLGADARLLPSLRAGGSIGYAPLQSSIVYPLVTTVSVNYALRGGARR
jgi:hypothetical protein